MAEERQGRTWPVSRRSIREVLSDHGLPGLLSRAVALAYRSGLRPLLPKKRQARYGGVAVPYSVRWGDDLVPDRWRPATDVDAPEYESGLVGALRELVRPGDTVVVVGGGLGVTATVAAQSAGPSGRVECFEAAGECVDTVLRTADLNDVSDRMSVHHAVVARAIAVYGTEPDRGIVEPTDLPECDLLELDCEGAELDILQGMTIRPRAVLVETHGLYGAGTSRIADLLRDRGYAVTDLGVAEPVLRTFCEENDIRVLAAERTEPAEPS